MEYPGEKIYTSREVYGDEVGCIAIHAFFLALQIQSIYQSAPGTWIQIPKLPNSSGMDGKSRPPVAQVGLLHFP